MRATIPRLIHIHRANLAGALAIASALAWGQDAPPVLFRHVRTFGSRQGIRPPRLLNRRAAKAALGEADHPYGLVFPVAVTTDLRRRVWIADSGTASVHVFDPVSGTYREIKRAGERPLVQPSGIASDAQGRVFVADAATGAVFMFDENGDDHAVVKPGAGVVVAPGAIAISEDGRTVYVADPPRNVIVELNREGEVNGAISLPPELSDPAAICVVHNQIYALGAREHRIGAFTPAGRQLGDLRWDDIALPAAFTFDAVRGRFLAANPRWMIVQIFEEEGRNLGAFGQAGDGVDQMQRVDALYVDRDGQVYVVDSRHGKVLVFAEAVHP